MKHCDSARSCFLHQSPFALHSFATLSLHRLHSSSGMPCSAHHHSSCFVSFGAPLATVSGTASFFGSGSVLPQPPTTSMKLASSAGSNPRIVHFPVMASSL